MAEKMRCPNCGAGVIADKDGRLVCPECGGSFAWQNGKAKLTDVAEFDKIKTDVGKLGESVEQIKTHLGIGQAKDAPADATEDEEDV